MKHKVLALALISALSLTAGSMFAAPGAGREGGGSKGFVDSARDQTAATPAVPGGKKQAASPAMPGNPKAKSEVTENRANAKDKTTSTQADKGKTKDKKKGKHKAEGKEKDKNEGNHKAEGKTKDKDKGKDTKGKGA
jgi:hypothetical protein